MGPVLYLTSCHQPVPKEVSHTPHREHRSRGDHGHRRSRQPIEAQSPNSQLVLAPSPAVVRASRRVTGQESRGGSREHISVQPLAPASRRASQRVDQRDRTTTGARESALVTPHPYANADTQAGYRTTAYGRSSPVQQPNGNQYTNGHSSSPVMPPTSDYQYGSHPPQSRQSGFDTRDHGTTRSGSQAVNGNKGMYMYENQGMSRGIDQDEHGDGRKRGFLAALCCRA